MKKYTLFVLILAACVSAAAYTRITRSNGDTPKWSSMPVSYWVNDRGWPDSRNGSEFAAIRASFRAWENVPSADVRVTYQGTTPLNAFNDGLNVVSFNDPAWGLFGGDSTVAVTLTYFTPEPGSDGVSRMIIRDADIIFNPSLPFSTSGEQDKFDIQSVLTHEVGHFFGLSHSGLVSSVMVPFAPRSLLDQRVLMYDDIAGISEIYPKGDSSALGSIAGTIRSGGTPAFGVHVVAVNSEGTPLVSTLTQNDGTYLLRSLPPGAYRVFAEPLDEPVLPAHIGSYYSRAVTEFGTTYFGNVSTLSEARSVTVNANATATGVDIVTLPQSATGLNVARPAFATRRARGAASAGLSIGGRDLTPGIAITASAPGLVLGSPSFGTGTTSAAPTIATVNVSVATTAPLGPKNVAVNRGADASIGSGAVVVTDPVPAGIAVAPANGPATGGGAVTITGNNFRSGAQVYFGGLAATAVSVVNGGTILANAPPNAPGTLNIVVVNADGTWGVARGAFTYETTPPFIGSVTPLSGPPSTLVTIDGQNFDSALSNVAVQFNGIAGRIVEASTTSLKVIVPFGATTGPLTVTVFDRSITGPVFTVTPLPSSPNVALPLFNFIDAGPDKGGTPLSFLENDDAAAFFTLPFKFSLFKDTYLAGSTVSITTNGFLNLDGFASAEFQNGPLPGQAVTRPDGSGGSVPPSLIAPFWDDLVMNGNSSITARVIGTEPNRRFVVQWSNMSILDEAGQDQNASLTFQAVLFEGSNDIQLLYSSVSGPRSNGSSATIGFQDLQRTSGIQIGFNEPVITSGYFKTFRFDNGAYTVLEPETTAPPPPAISDEGVLTANATQLAASWTASDPESGVREYRYAVGTTPGGADVRGFTTTENNSAVITGLSLQPGKTYYFAVIAINGAGLASEAGVSDGIRYDATYRPETRVVASAPSSASEFSGVALLAPVSMTAVMRAYDANGALITGPGVRNPATVSLAAGQQYAKVVSEIFGSPLEAFDGWIEVEASQPGLGVFTATGSRDMSALDGVVPRDLSTDFLLFHAGATATLVNPSSGQATVLITTLATRAAQSLVIPSRGRLVLTLAGPTRIQSSTGLAAMERTAAAGKVALNAAAPVSDSQPALVFPHAISGGGYNSTLTLVNMSATTQTVTLGFGGSTATVTVATAESTRVSLQSLFPALTGMKVGSLSVTATGSLGPALFTGVVDIENPTGLVTIAARPAANTFAFPHVANTNGLFTGLALATGNNAARITIDVYPSGGGTPKSATITLAANQQIAKLVGELVNGVADQVGGYIRIQSDQAMWAWEVYGSELVMAAGPPL